MTATIARLKITLDNMEPAVIRRIEAPFDIRLDHLHLLIQAAMGWTNSHLYELRAGDVGWGMPDPHWPDGPLDARKACLADVVEDIGTKTLRYIYDFGDGWEHTIKIERLGDPEPSVVYPRLIEARGRCPPEDVGGPWGYGELLEAIADPKHERHGSRNGSPATSTRLSSIPKGWPTTSLPSPRNGRANQPPSARATLDRGPHRMLTPRPSPRSFDCQLILSISCASSGSHHRTDAIGPILPCRLSHGLVWKIRLSGKSRIAAPDLPQWKGDRPWARHLYGAHDPKRKSIRRLSLCADRG